MLFGAAQKGIYMKKNLMTVIILALLVVNLVLTGIMMFSVTSTSQKTAALIGQIGTILNLELEPVADAGGEEVRQVSIENTEFRDLTDKMTIRLAPTADDPNPHYVIVEATILLDTTHEDYKKLSEKISTSVIQSLFFEKLGTYTYESLTGHEDEARAEVLKAIQDMFDTDMIYDVKFKSIMMQ